MAMRNELDYFAVFFRRFDDILSFTVTKACHGLCANVKTLSIFSILLLLFLMVVALSYVQEKPTLPEEESRERGEEDDRWVALFWFFWYISDWMGSDLYSGEHGKLYSVAIPLYTIGYWYGARCLLLTWAATGLMSLAVEPIGRALGGAKNLWAAGNFILAGGLAMTLYISKLAKDEQLKRNDLTFTREPSNGIQAWVLPFFGVLGIFLTITLSVALALASIYSNKSGAVKERNELGYFTIFFRRFDDMLSFTEIKACHGLCTNVKTLSIFSILLLLFLMAVALSCVQDKPALPEKESHERKKEDDRWQVVKCFWKNFGP
ncbi:sucrose transport protein SUC1-like [Arachis hypogaea]|uniref:sucrose transport protein SUC1-like n=1 Tax=Arachis hypogaea TaxID=3818 RepID=UPI000DEC347F|nr:sucrose transport protein SUC1-like [Arachis hypogaea]